MLRLVKIILSNFIKHSSINNYLTDFMNSNNFLDYDQVYLDLHKSDLISKKKKLINAKFKKNNIKFIFKFL